MSHKRGRNELFTVTFRAVSKDNAGQDCGLRNASQIYVYANYREIDFLMYFWGDMVGGPRESTSKSACGLRFVHPYSSLSSQVRALC